MLKIILLWMMLLGAVVPAYTESKRAFKLLEKGEWDKLVELLDKSIEKDSINCGAKYVYSLLYLTPEFTGYDIDMAYSYIEEAISDLEKHDEKAIEELGKLDITHGTLNKQKAIVQQRAFVRAKELHSIDAYNFFIENFDDGLRADSAVAFRNEIAYQNAVSTGTYEAFYAFMQHYPDAVQLADAETSYEMLLYNAKTADKSQESYESFLSMYPSTPYRDDAERNIFEISTAGNQLESYADFLNRYPKSQMRRRALGLLYHRLKESPVSIGHHLVQSDDSLSLIAMAEEGCLIPIFEMDKYGFSKLNGDKVIDFSYSKIKEDYLCGNIEADFLEVEKNGEKMIVSRVGTTIYQGDYDQVQDMGCGTLKISYDGYCGVYHKSGFQMLDFSFEEVGLVADAFIKFKFNGKWGLKSFMGRDILPPEHDAIDGVGSFVLVEDDGLLAVQNIENLAAAANRITPKLDFRYDDYELMDENQLLLFQGDKETVIDGSLKEFVPLAKQNFYQFFAGWLVKGDNRIQCYDRHFKPLSDLVFDDINYNGKRAAIKFGNRWGVYEAGGTFPTSFQYDSVRFLSEQIGIMVIGDSTFGIFSNDSIVNISYSMETRLLLPGAKASAADIYAQYLLTRTAAGVFKVFDINGKIILDGKFRQVEALGKEYLLVEKGGKKGLYHRSGEMALKTNYNAVGNYENGYVSTLINGRFGIYNYEKKVFLSTKYEKQLKPLGSRYFIGSKRSGFGLADLENKDATSYQFDEIRPWNDSVALVLKQGTWKLYDIPGGGHLIDGISDFSELRKDNEETILLIKKEGKMGVLSNLHGLIVGPTFDDIVNVGTVKNPVYFCEKYIKEADFYVVIYYNAEGKILRKQVFTEPEEYAKIYCG
jgi:tetratricopeptide (TPR) repeat protein